MFGVWGMYIMLSALIAIISNSLDGININKDVVIYREKAKMILEYEVFRSIVGNPKNKFRYVIACSPKASQGTNGIDKNE